MLCVTVNSIDDTDQVTRAMAQSIQVPLMLALCGTLGAGKTHFTRALALHMGIESGSVTSPTYVLVQRYTGNKPVYHIDFYRLTNVQQAWDLGLDDFFEEPALTIIEWADKFIEAWPEDVLRCDIAVQDAGTRSLTFTSRGKRATQVLEALREALPESLRAT